MTKAERDKRTCAECRAYVKKELPMYWSGRVAAFLCRACWIRGDRT